MKQIYTAALSYVNDKNGCICPARDYVTYLLEYFPGEERFHNDMSGVFLCPSTARCSTNPNIKMENSYATTKARWGDPEPTAPYGGWARVNGMSAYRYSGKKINRVIDNSVLLIESWLYDYANNYGWAFNTAGSPSHYSYTNNCNGEGEGEQSIAYRHNNQANFLFKDGHVQGFKYGQQFNGEWQPK
jgi:prepilin-type processing-associated H-X9-DG protein